MAKKHIVATLIVEVDEDHDACSSNQNAFDYIRSLLSLESLAVLSDLRVMIAGGESPVVPKPEAWEKKIKNYLYKDYEVEIVRAYYSKRRKGQTKYFAGCSNTRVKTKGGHIVSSVGNISLKDFQSEVEQHLDRKAIAREKREKKNRAGEVGASPAS